MMECYFWAQNGKIALNKTLFWKNHLNNFDVPFGHFDCGKFLKNPSSGSSVMTTHHFWAQNGPFVLKDFFRKAYAWQAQWLGTTT